MIANENFGLTFSQINYLEHKLEELKDSQRPSEKKFPGKPNERNVEGEYRLRTRPWDNCWFSRKPHIISLTVEQALNQYPNYILWCYKNLSIKWSVHTVKLIENKFSNQFKNPIL